MLYLYCKLREALVNTDSREEVNMEELKGFVKWQIDYKDGTREVFKAFTEEKSKALQIAQYKALNGRDVKEVNRIA